MISLAVKTVRRVIGAVAGVLLTLGASATAEAATLDDVRSRGHLLCGVADGPLGFSHVDEQGRWSGLEVDFCAAVAAAIFGDKSAVKFRSLPAAERFAALRSGDVDLLARSATWTLSRDMDLGIKFVDTLFYDGQAMMVRRSQGITSVLELSGASICLLANGPAQQNVREFFGHRGMRFTLVASDSWDQAVQGYANKRCMALSADMSTLALTRTTLPDPDEHQFLPEVLSKEPRGPAVRQDDPQWFGIIRWVLFALLTAEEYGITSSNVESAKASNFVEVRRLLGTEGDLGASLGLSRTWAYDAIQQVGNYGEIFERNLGKNSALKLERQINNLWSQGGLMQAPPFR
ncbi:MAG: amino acid ABC transporter substrate-binding protein [Proteobacteria bacterium]|jgi:general L-amino acid transport system substrate-binding protein|nr:MAG: amino acid ABC transporter substrate-binding protein [Pseudomonadota bacterium]